MNHFSDSKEVEEVFDKNISTEIPSKSSTGRNILQHNKDAV